MFAPVVNVRTSRPLSNKRHRVRPDSDRINRIDRMGGRPLSHPVYPVHPVQTSLPERRARPGHHVTFPIPSLPSFPSVNPLLLHLTATGHGLTAAATGS
jgi:hypothetical protein